MPGDVAGSMPAAGGRGRGAGGGIQIGCGGFLNLTKPSETGGWSVLDGIVLRIESGSRKLSKNRPRGGRI